MWRARRRSSIRAAPSGSTMVPRWMGEEASVPGKVTVGVSRMIPRPRIQALVRALPRSSAMPGHSRHTGRVVVGKWRVDVKPGLMPVTVLPL